MTLDNRLKKLEQKMKRPKMYQSEPIFTPQITPENVGKVLDVLHEAGGNRLIESVLGEKLTGVNING